MQEPGEWQRLPQGQCHAEPTLASPGPGHTTVTVHLPFLPDHVRFSPERSPCAQGAGWAVWARQAPAPAAQ